MWLLWCKTIFMWWESAPGYLYKFFAYTGADTHYIKPGVQFQKQFEEYRFINMETTRLHFNWVVENQLTHWKTHYTLSKGIFYFLKNFKTWEENAEQFYEKFYVVLCVVPCFEIYHTRKYITKEDNYSNENIPFGFFFNLGVAQYMW